MAEPDHVTGLQPRGVLETTLSTHCGTPAEPGGAGAGRAPMALAILDVVGLKNANELDGFLAGDALLRAAAERLRQAAGSATLLARLGGDELVAVFVGPNAADEAELAARTLAAGPAPPRLRATASAVRAADTPATLIERLYATLRRC